MVTLEESVAALRRLHASCKLPVLIPPPAGSLEEQMWDKGISEIHRAAITLETAYMLAEKRRLKEPTP